jgi:pentatricopeptide repeat protein
MTVIRFVLRRFDNEIYEEAIRSKNFDEAIKFCEKKIDFSFKKDAEAWNQLVDVYFLKGDSEKVIYTLKSMMEIKMRNNQAFKRLLDFYLSEADYNNTVEICNQYLEIYPNTSIIPYALDQIYQKFSKVDEITNHFKKLINLADRYITRFPTKHELNYLIAKIYEEQGDLEKSLERINKALEIRSISLIYQKYKENLLLRLKNTKNELNNND